MSRRARGASGARWIGGGILAAALAGGCEKPSAPAPIFEGARGIALECLRTRAAPSQHEIERLVDALIEAAGGREAFAKLDYHVVEDLYHAHPTDMMSNHVLRESWVRPDLTIRTNLDYGTSGLEQRVMFRGDVYLSGRGLPLVAGTGANQQFAEWDWELSTLPWSLARAIGLVPLPLRDEEGRTLVGVQVDLDLLPKFEAWVDPAGPAIVEVVAELPLTGDQTVRSHTTQKQRFADFRRVNGLLFPHRRDVFVDGQRFELGEVRSIETGAAFEDKVFLPEGKPR